MRGYTTKAAILVCVQFASLFILVLTTSALHLSLPGIIFCIAAIVLAAWAIAVMRSSRLRISPVPHEEASLITNGPYRFIRHPMYASLLLGSIGLLFFYFSWPRFIVVMILLTDLIIKLGWEEELLANKFAGYKQYQENTSRLFPFLF